jgi:SAM-dependent methyltransferase
VSAVCESPFAPALLVCPRCHARPTSAADGLRCGKCGKVYPIVDGIPVLLLDVQAAEHDELHEHHHTRAARNQQQTQFFDHQVDVEFEVTRPHGTPALYRWYYEEKFRISIAGLEAMLPGATVLTVCGGSGMDAEFLALRGARVIASDLSLGAMRRTCERARRYNLPIEPLVADVTKLPFADRSIDLVYVHDGLHHLEDPFEGLREMTRVAGRAVSLTEPADAWATKIAVHLGLSMEWEEAGNRVARMKEKPIGDFLRSQGFIIGNSSRYAMYYKHHPGRFIAWLSKPGVLEVTRKAVRLGNALIGRFGNRLGMTAVRDGATAPRLFSA